MNVTVLPRARADLLESADHLTRESPGLGERFYEAADATFEQLAAMPEMGVVRDFGLPRLAGMRMFRVRDFPQHVVFYRVTAKAVEIVRVLHAARNVAAQFETP